MLIVFEVFIEQGQSTDDLLTEEAQRETQAQIMTLEEATKLGFSGLKPDANGRQTRLVAVAPRDKQFVQRRLEAHPHVVSFRIHEIDL